MSAPSMNSRELVRALIARQSTSRPGFWIGKPSPEMERELCAFFGVSTLFGVYEKLGDDIRWVTPQYVGSTYRAPDGSPMRPWKEANPHGMAGGPLAQAQTVEQVDAYAWPRAAYCDFSETIATLRSLGPYYRLSGFWSPFFHDLTYLLGTEQLLLMMCMNPDLVHRILERVCSFYLEANERFLSEADGLVDGVFFGNDFGTQHGLLMSPGQFEEFFLPWVRRFCAQAHGHGVQAVLHSCGSIAAILDRLIEAGVDCIHPLQPKARDMDAVSLQRFAGRIAFMGGIDTQELLVSASPVQVRTEVARVRGLLGPHYIVGPSHEAMLPGIPIPNIAAMAEGAR